jgi:hypothetical protein
MKEKRKIPKFKSEADEAAWVVCPPRRYGAMDGGGRHQRPDHHAFRGVAARTPAGRGDANSVHPDRAG